MKKMRTFTPDEDAPLLLAWHRGDASAFETLLSKYLKRVFNCAFYLTGSEESAAAASQAAFVAAYANINSFSSRFHFSNWLVSLALKEARALLDLRTAGLPEGAAAAAGLHEQLAKHLRQLPPELAEVLVLRYVRGYSLERMTEIYQLRTDILVARLVAGHEMLMTQLNRGTAPPAADGTPTSPHPEIRRSFHAYLDSSLSIEDAAAVKRHLKSCGSCREALAGLEWILEHLKELPVIEPPHWLPAAILERVQLVPAKQAAVQEKGHPRLLQLGAAMLCVVITGLAAYLLLHDRDGQSRPVAGRETGQVVEPPSLQAPQQGKAAGFVTSITAPFRTPGRPSAPGGSSPEATVPPPQAAPAAESPAHAPQPAVSAPLPAAVKSEPSGRRERGEKPAELPAEWGESPPVVKPQQKKAAVGRSRSNDLAVEMTTEDPTAAIQAIENAVAAAGGKITGRAYSGGSDVLYTRIEIDRFFDLMSRLGKVGTIEELPQSPEGIEGAVDLIIRWR